jgi:hypothetical protein
MLAAHTVRIHDTGTRQLHHPAVGNLTLTYNRMELAADRTDAHDLDRRTGIHLGIFREDAESVVLEKHDPFLRLWPKPLYRALATGCCAAQRHGP